uniref:Uncharacterized protein n=1 Tax=Ciona savignyi TaxID=51511 RepID=H2Y6N6_CIOSA
MAVDNVSGKPFGCNELISSHEMMRPSNKVPVIGLCNEHRERMIRHECCPGCGTFCSGGKFLVCIKNDNFPHRFHRDCMVLSGQMSNCPHCGGDSTSVKEVNLVPNMDKDLLLILAGRDPAKTKRKNYLQIRGCKSARMGYAKGSQYNPDFPPGVSVKFGRLDISTSTLMLGPQRDGLEELLQALQQEPLQKVRFQAKNFLQFVQQNNISKMIQMLTDGLEARIDTLNKALHEALPTCQLSTIHVLLESGADINSRDEEGNTPLIKAILLKNKELIIYLLFNKADVTVKDDDMGMTCFHHAAKEGYIEGCHLLMSYGRAKVNTVDDGGWTPIVWAAEHKQTETARYLLFYGANVKIIDNEGNTCLQWAALSGNLEILKMCLDCNSDVNHYNTHGDTALHIASRQNNYNCLTALLAHGADCNLKNRDGHLPIDCAQEKTLTWMSLKIHMCIRNACLIRREILPYNRERVLCKDMSRGYDKMPIVCVNAHDDAPCPTDPPNGFHYVTENVHTSQDTRINAVISGIQSCQCKDNCSTPDCTCGLISEQCWYASDGTLVPEFDILEPPLVFECNKMCSCSRNCKNRVVQNGIRYRLQIYRTQGMGWGLRALETIPRGAFVCEYVGELLTDDEADQREDDSYLFDLENKEGEIYCIDARNYGNVSRFINHLCEPNLVPIRVFVGHHDIRFPILAYFTTRVIQADEELGFDYGDRFWDVKCRQFTCQCGSPLCKYSAEVYRKKAEFETQQKETGNASEDVTKEGDDVTTTNNDVTN